MQAALQKPHGRFQTEHVVHVLDGRAARTLHQIVNGRNKNDPRAIFADRYVHVIRSCDKSSGRQMRNNSYERAGVIVGVQAFPNLIGGYTRRWMDVDSGQDPTFHGG